MEYRQLGKTDLHVSALGFGAATLGDVYSTVQPREAARAVHLAIERGINFFDVSPYYGETLAEQRLGEALAGRRDQVVLATKCGRYGFDRFDFSAARVTASADESLQRLRTDRIDLFHIHDVEFGAFDTIVNETIPALRQLQQAGKVRYIGITGYPVAMLARLLESTPVDAVLSYSRYNLANIDLNEELAPLARKQGIGLINASPLNMGLLTASGPPAWHPAPEDMKAAARSAARLCAERNADISKIALRFCLDHPYVSSTLVGISTVDQLEANLAVLDSEPDPELMMEIRGLFQQLSSTAWPSGLPANDALFGPNAAQAAVGL